VVLAGDAAHPMGPSAGAGMMAGMAGVWRLAGRLQTIVEEPDMTRIHQVLADYESEQRQGSKQIQRANALTFAQISLRNSVLATIRSAILRFLSLLPFVKRKIINDDSMTNQTIEVAPFPAY
jgi:2-polyprenyl-6-methoxyphenol hydroxylase-like FAD-dependent oxidoreductase